MILIKEKLKEDKINNVRNEKRDIALDASGIKKKWEDIMNTLYQ